MSSPARVWGSSIHATMTSRRASSTALFLRVGRCHFQVRVTNVWLPRKRTSLVTSRRPCTYLGFLRGISCDDGAMGYTYPSTPPHRSVRALRSLVVGTWIMWPSNEVLGRMGHAMTSRLAPAGHAAESRAPFVPRSVYTTQWHSPPIDVSRRHLLDFSEVFELLERVVHGHRWGPRPA